MNMHDAVGGRGGGGGGGGGGFGGGVINVHVDGANENIEEEISEASSNIYGNKQVLNQQYENEQRKSSFVEPRVESAIDAKVYSASDKYAGTLPGVPQDNNNETNV